MRETDVAIIGTGFGGLGMAIQLKKQGTPFILFEQAAEVGGTWRDNTYPGAACDIYSHLYSFSFELNPGWSSMYGKQGEIQDYLEHCAKKYEVLSNTLFNAKVVGARFDQEAGRWVIELIDGTKYRARYVVSATGGLSRPKLPTFDGLDTFTKPAFHSATWRHDVDLTNKRVAVVGTGASAIQLIPQLAKTVEKLFVFQRTPAWVIEKDDRPIGSSEQQLYKKLPLLQRLYRWGLYWSLEWRVIAFVKYPQLASLAQKEAEKYLRKVVSSPELRRKLTPDYTFGCKRVLLANDYYPALQQPNVELVTDGIDKFSPSSIVANDGVSREIDAVVFCTGFDAAENVVPFEIYGLDGASLDDNWRNGAEAYLGTTVHGFPNWYFVVGPNTGLGHNSMVFIIESQIAYIRSCMREIEKRQAKYADVLPRIQSDFNDSLQRRMNGTVWKSGCQSWYQTSDGKVTTLWPSFSAEFKIRTRKMRPHDYVFV